MAPSRLRSACRAPAELDRVLQWKEHGRATHKTRVGRLEPGENRSVSRLDLLSARGINRVQAHTGAGCLSQGRAEIIYKERVKQLICGKALME